MFQNLPAIEKLLIAPSITLLKNSVYDKAGVAVSMARFDAVHPTINGNKPFKLYYNIQEAIQLQKQTLLTFGGPFSNHIAATAATGNLLNLETIGIIRGDELSTQSNKTIRQAARNGMHLYFVSRSEYHLRNTSHYLTQLQTRFPHAYIIPEGGDNQAGVRGAALMVNRVPNHFTHLVTAVGTGTTCCGIAIGSNAKVCGIMVHKQLQLVQTQMRQHLHEHEDVFKRISLVDDFHFGGYGKCTLQLNQYCEKFFLQHGITIEPIYTGKMMFAIDELIGANNFAPGSSILCLHTGGLQYLE